MARWLDGWKTKWLIGLVLLLILLNVVDGFFTAYHINHGKVEANPIVQYFIKALGLNAGVFVSKLIIIPAAAVLLWKSHTGDGRILARFGLLMSCALYGMLALYQISLLFVES